MLEAFMCGNKNINLLMLVKVYVYKDHAHLCQLEENAKFP